MNGATPESDLTPVDRIAKMKGQKDLVAEIAMLMNSPGRRLAGAIVSPAARIAGCLKTVAEKEGDDGA